MLETIIWNVNHGSAAYFSTPKGENIVVDLGASDDFSPLLFLKNKVKIDEVDGVIVTHPHRDHLDDIENFDALKVRVLKRPHIDDAVVKKGNRTEDKEKIEKYLAIDKRYSLPVADTDNPFLAQNNGVQYFKTFFPKDGGDNLNNHSIVTVVQYAGLKLVIPGDNEPASINKLLEGEEFKKAIKHADVLVAPHHGRESGYSAELLSAIDDRDDNSRVYPRLVIVSDGRFGDTSATSRYSQRATGWEVQTFDGQQSKKVYCITTRNSGHVRVKFYVKDNKSYLDVEVETL